MEAWRLGSFRGLEAWRLGSFRGLEARRLGGLEAWRLRGLEAWRLRLRFEWLTVRLRVWQVLIGLGLGCSLVPNDKLAPLISSVLVPPQTTSREEHGPHMPLRDLCADDGAIPVT